MTDRAPPHVTRIWHSQHLQIRSIVSDPDDTDADLPDPVGPSASWSSSCPSHLRITRVFSCVARGFKTCASFMSAGCCWWRSLAVDGGSGDISGTQPVMRRPGSRSTGTVVRPSVFRRSGLPVRVIRSKRGWMPSCASGGGWLPTLLSPLLSVSCNPVAAGGGLWIHASDSSRSGCVRSAGCVLAAVSGPRHSRVMSLWSC